MSRKEGHGAGEKVRLVRRILKSKLSISAASQEAGVEEATIRRWVAWYKAEENEVFQTAEKYRAYSPELKRQAVETYLAGEPRLHQASQEPTVCCGKHPEPPIPCGQVQ